MGKGWLTDAETLRKQQYHTTRNLSARVRLHQRFSSNPLGWQQWVFQQLDLTSGMKILEVGCGYAQLWQDNLYRLPAPVEIDLSDDSVGMITEAKKAVTGYPLFRCWVSDAQNIPVSGGVFDLVIANHMLYHVPDLPRALREMRSVTKPDGRLAASTNGGRHLNELDLLIREFEPRYEVDAGNFMSYSLENASAILKPYFQNIQVIRYDDHLWVTEAGALADYIFSLPEFTALVSEQRRSELEGFLQARINRDGGIFIFKDAGIAIAS